MALTFCKQINRHDLFLFSCLWRKRYLVNQNSHEDYAKYGLFDDGSYSHQSKCVNRKYVGSISAGAMILLELSTTILDF